MCHKKSTKFHLFLGRHKNAQIQFHSFPRAFAFLASLKRCVFHLYYGFSGFFCLCSALDNWHPVPSSSTEKLTVHRGLK